MLAHISSILSLPPPLPQTYGLKNKCADPHYGRQNFKQTHEV
jgi:hypothetical protein